MLRYGRSVRATRGILSPTGSDMSDHIYKSVEVTGSSATDTSEAIRLAVAKASQTLRNLEWFEVVSVRGHIADGKVAHFQVTMKVGFKLE